MPLPSSSPRHSRSQGSHVCGRVAGSWVWTLAPPGLSGRSVHPQPGKGSVSWQANLQSHSPTASPSAAWKKRCSSGCAVQQEPHGSFATLTFSKSLCFNNVHWKPEQHRDINTSLKWIHLPWKIHLIPFVGEVHGEVQYKNKEGCVPCYCPCSAPRLRLHYRSPPHMHTGKSQGEQMI